MTISILGIRPGGVAINIYSFVFRVTSRDSIPPKPAPPPALCSWNCRPTPVNYILNDPLALPSWLALNVQKYWVKRWTLAAEASRGFLLPLAIILDPFVGLTDICCTIRAHTLAVKRSQRRCFVVGFQVSFGVGRFHMSLKGRICAFYVRLLLCHTCGQGRAILSRLSMRERYRVQVASALKPLSNNYYKASGLW